MSEIQLEYEGGHIDKRTRKDGKNGNKDKSSKSHYEMEEAETNIMGDHEEVEDEDGNGNFGEHKNQMDHDDDEEENAQNLLAGAGLEDSDAEDEAAHAGQLLLVQYMMDARLGELRTLMMLKAFNMFNLCLIQ